MKQVEVFTDGACKGNPGPGGWGVLIRYNGSENKVHEKNLHGGEDNTTNNRMELMAAIMALESLTQACQVNLTTDSKYVKDGITSWMADWKKRGWKTAAKKPVKNLDLWKRLDEATKKHEIEWHWVKGHSGHEENEIADVLANKGVDEILARKK